MITSSDQLKYEVLKAWKDEYGFHRKNGSELSPFLASKFPNLPCSPYDYIKILIKAGFVDPPSNNDEYNLIVDTTNDFIEKFGKKNNQSNTTNIQNIGTNYGIANQDSHSSSSENKTYNAPSKEPKNTAKKIVIGILVAVIGSLLFWGISELIKKF